MYRLHKRKILALSEWLILEKCKESLTETESTRRRHAMFEHLDEIPVRHHRFIISPRKHSLLLLESRSLVEWIIELAVSIPNF